MRNEPIAILASIGILFALLGAPAQTPAGSVDEKADQALDRWAEALGGRARLEKVESVHVQSKIEVSGLSGTIEEWGTTSGLSRQFVDLGVFRSLTVIGEDGAWTVSPNGITSDLAGGELEGEITGAFLGSFSHFFADRMPGTVRHAGKDDTGKNDVLEIQAEGGRAVRITLDSETGLERTFPRRSQESPQVETVSAKTLFQGQEIINLLFTSR